MVKCTKCGKEIDHVCNWQSGENCYALDEKGEYEFEGFQTDGQVNKFCCPECEETLFTDESKAIMFLKGK